MPLYLIEDGQLQRRLVYAKTPRGAENHYLKNMREQHVVKSVTPIEAACLASEGIPVETVGRGPDKIMADDPPEARRGEPEPASTAKHYEGDPPPWEDPIPEGEENTLFNP